MFVTFYPGLASKGWYNSTCPHIRMYSQRILVIFCLHYVPSVQSFTFNQPCLTDTNHIRCYNVCVFLVQICLQLNWSRSVCTCGLPLKETSQVVLVMNEEDVHEHFTLSMQSCLFISFKNNYELSVSTSKAHLLWYQWKHCGYVLLCTLCVLSRSQRDCVLQRSVQVTMPS